MAALLGMLLFMVDSSGGRGTVVLDGDLGELSELEQRLCQAFRSGQRVDLRAQTPSADESQFGARWAAERTVRAEVIAALLLAPGPSDDGRVARLRLVSVRISGTLDLSFARITVPVEFENCFFDNGVTLEEATTCSIRLIRCQLPFLEAGTLTVTAKARSQ